ncbi:hypothetical protein GEMRC1_007017 [Eukaryota sp. GEM-RC1]
MKDSVAPSVKRYIELVNTEAAAQDDKLKEYLEKFAGYDSAFKNYIVRPIVEDNMHQNTKESLLKNHQPENVCPDQVTTKRISFSTQEVLSALSQVWNSATGGPSLSNYQKPFLIG